ncbi:MAG: trigger factor [Candidatus Sungbacteria bacterium RIFCSPLOWO2_01_FULL_47_32]|uniref:Trigger factor n=1 Tax=Candidatus Sungbacteria bacterium RIFCSPHIGHO2_01_FULL_47_32 TaxID=1802264 RepID=A0A1G2K971_9BACT|nr:MAG: Trigger factor [Parcubacteria group bacterium GW2011_GWA2_47_10]OGZ95979.1 MAG: trigger factor [Candidatus Sungbacteria bacterium RIFCSPHIGHO2_01_FULL_47_32]OGZ98905.1 MAG: trigger factor [Candidatus Sungbacteria bacterium RIFCSPHIGHO2_02_FULL_46_12]OHA06098.1 MAG: trigger factor [Candidatus Sungbacteria bacterium RIFCSPLOWO2_01_FULL_47_32]
MKFSTQKTPKSKIEITVSVPAEELALHLESAARSLSKARPMEGFRPGKAPMGVVKQRFGEFAVYEQAAKMCIEKQYLKIVEELGGKKNGEENVPGIEPIGHPEISITKLAPKEDFEYKIVLSVIPELNLPDYKKNASSVTKTKKPVVVEDKEVDEALKSVRESRAPLITVSRPAERGDIVEIDFETFDGDRKLNGIESKSHPIAIGEGRFIPGFEDNLIGIAAGETKEFNLKLPTDFQNSSLAGKEVTFRATARAVQEKHVPELTDEFAKSVGNFSDLEALKKNVREGILMEKEHKERDRIRMEIIDGIAKKADAELPELLIERELDKMEQELKSGVEHMGLSFDDYLLNIKKSPEELRKDWRKDAEKRVRGALILRKIADAEHIEPEHDEVQAEADRFVMRSGLAEHEIKKIDKEQLFEYARGVRRNEKVFEFLEKQ